MFKLLLICMLLALICLPHSEWRERRDLKVKFPLENLKANMVLAKTILFRRINDVLKPLTVEKRMNNQKIFCTVVSRLILLFKNFIFKLHAKQGWHDLHHLI